MIGLEYCVALIAYLYVFSSYESGNVDSFTVLVSGGSKIPYYDIVGILVCLENVRNLNSDLTVEAGNVLTVNGHLEVVDGLAVKKGLLLFGEALSHLVYLVLVYRSYGKRNVRSAELILYVLVKRKRCIGELELVLELFAGCCGAVTADDGLSVSTFALAVLTVVVSFGCAVGFGIELTASTGVGLNTVYLTGSLSGNCGNVNMSYGLVTYLLDKLSANGTVTGSHGNVGTSLALYGNSFLVPFNTLFIVTGSKITFGYSLGSATYHTGVKNVTVLGTGRICYNAFIPAVAERLVSESLAASGAVRACSTGSVYNGVTESVDSLKVLTAAVGTSVLNVACLGTGSGNGLDNLIAVTESRGNVGGVAVAALGAYVLGVTAVITGGSNNVLLVGVTESCYDLSLGVTARGASRGLKTCLAAGGLKHFLNVGVAESRGSVYSGSVVTAVCITLCGNEAAVSTIGLNLNLYNVMIAEITIGEGLGGSVLTALAMLEVYSRRLAGRGCLKVLSVCDLNEIVTAGYYKIGVLNDISASLIAEELVANVAGPIFKVSVSTAGRKHCCVIGSGVRSELTIGEGLSSLLATSRTGLVVNCELLAGCL